jgi:AraC family transcriptional regulator
VIQMLNEIVAEVEHHLDAELDLASVAARHGSTEYHARRMFSSLAGMPLSEYVRRRRMTLAAAAVVAGEPLLGIAVRHGHASVEAFGRAFRSVHGVSHGQVRQHGGPLRSQSQLRFRLTVEGKTPMDATIIDLPAQRLIGHAARVPLLHRGPNPAIAAHLAGIPAEEYARLKALSSARPSGLLQVSADVDPDGAEGSELTYLHGVAVGLDTAVPEDLDTIDLPAGSWVRFRTEGEHPAALQEAYAASATEWFPSTAWRLREGPSIVSIVEHNADFTTATCELWFPIERD